MSKTRTIFTSKNLTDGFLSDDNENGREYIFTITNFDAFDLDVEGDDSAVLEVTYNPVDKTISARATIVDADNVSDATFRITDLTDNDKRAIKRLINAINK